MTPPSIPRPVLAATGLLLVAAVISTGWRLADPSARTQGAAVASLPPTRGPIDPAFCGPLDIPLPPPPLDSPYGLHLYAATPKGSVHLLPTVAEVLARLPAPAARRTGAAPPVPPAEPPPQSAAATAPPLSPNETAEEDVQALVILLEEYRRAFGAMPMGEQNYEIVSRMQGENPKGIAVLPKSHPNISAEGELLDRWGTPYRFHPESAWHTTVRSAGPDQEMWTADDLLSHTQEPDAPSLTSSF